MSSSDNASELHLFESLNYQIAPRPEENDTRTGIARMPPGTPFNVPQLRRLSWLNTIESVRRDACSQIRELASNIDTKQVDMLIESGIMNSLLSLTGFFWCPGDIKQDATQIVSASVSVASDEQVRVLVQLGCIPVVCDGLSHYVDMQSLLRVVIAVKRILEVGQSDIATIGRNIYADQIEASNGLDRLKRIQKKSTNKHKLLDDALTNIFKYYGHREIERSLEEKLQDTSERGLGWRLLYPFFKNKRFPKWNAEEVTELHTEDACPLKINLFISHRWEKLSDPDPAGEQFRSLTEYLSRVFMVSNGLIGKDQYAIKELVIGDELLSDFHQSQVLKCQCNTDPYLDVRDLLGDIELYYTRTPDIHLRRKFYKLLKHVHVWYDYASIPQAPRTSEQQVLFDHALAQLANIASTSRVIVMWGIESLHRAWCLLEGIIGNTLYICSPAPEMSLTDQFFNQVVEPALTGDTALVGYRGRNSLSIAIQLKILKQDIMGKSENEIMEYFAQHGITCTNREDVAIVARLLHHYCNSEDAR